MLYRTQTQQRLRKLQTVSKPTSNQMLWCYNAFNSSSISSGSINFNKRRGCCNNSRISKLLSQREPISCVSIKFENNFSSREYLTFLSVFSGLSNSGVQSIDSLLNNTVAPNVTLTSRGAVVTSDSQVSPNYNTQNLMQQLSPSQQRGNTPFSPQANQSELKAFESFWGLFLMKASYLLLCRFSTKSFQ